MQKRFSSERTLTPLFIFDPPFWVTPPRKPKSSIPLKPIFRKANPALKKGGGSNYAPTFSRFHFFGCVWQYSGGQTFSNSSQMGLR